MTVNHTFRLSKAIRKRFTRRIYRCARISFAIGLSLVCPIMALIFLMSWPFPSAILSGCVIVIALGSIFLGWRWALASSILDSEDVQTAISECIDEDCLPQMIELLKARDEPVRRVAAQTLCYLLDNRDYSKPSHLRPHHWRILVQQLSRDDVTLIIAILGAFSRLGDARVLPAVERIACSTSRFALEREIGKEAERTVVSLRESLQHSAQALLRPVNTLSSNPNELLRPVSQGAELALDELLHPIEQTSAQRAYTEGQRL